MWAHSTKVQSTMMGKWQQECEVDVTLCPWGAEKQGAFSLLSPAPERGLPVLVGPPILSQLSLEAPSHRCAGVCLLGESRSCQDDNLCEPLTAQCEEESPVFSCSLGESLAQTSSVDLMQHADCDLSFVIRVLQGWEQALRGEVGCSGNRLKRVVAGVNSCMLFLSHPTPQALLPITLCVCIYIYHMCIYECTCM